MGEPAAGGATCADCGTALAGPYCHACGQRAHLHRSLLHFAEEMLHGVLHFDAKGWRTLPLLIARPGLLTRRYIDGQRTRHVSPLALFLFSVFLMFLVFSLTGASPQTSAMLDAAQRAEARGELVTAVDEAGTEVAAQQQALDDARSRPAAAADAQAALAAALRQQQIAQAALAAFDASLRDKGEAGAQPSPWTEAAARVDTGSPALDAAIRGELANPQLALYKLKTAAYKLSFMLVPISLPFLWLLFARRRDVVLYDHAVFSLYSLSFMSLWFVVLALLSAAWPKAPFGWLAVAVPPVHMFVQLRGAYGLTVGAASWRTVAMLAAAGVVFLLYLALVAVVAA